MTTRKTVVENGIYHVTQRAPGKEVMFVEDADYLRFLKVLKTVPAKFKLKILCFALLPNHVHLLLRTTQPNLSEAVKYLFQSYALWFNKKYGRKGHVVCGKYRAAFCEDENYLLNISLYIHLNPYKAGLAENPSDCRWTSILCYTREDIDSFVDSSEILALFTGARPAAVHAYKNLLEDIKSIRYKNVLADDCAVRTFSEDAAKLFEKLQHKYQWHENILRALKIRAFIEGIAAQGGNKFRDVNALLYCIAQLRSQGYAYEEIAQKLKINRATIYRYGNKSVPDRNVARMT